MSGHKITCVFVASTSSFNVFLYISCGLLLGEWGSPAKCPADAKRRSAHPSGISLFGGQAHRT